MYAHNYVFPLHTPPNPEGYGGDTQYGISTQQYIAVEMAKALIGRKDSMIFNKEELAKEALEMAAALMKVVP
jgi:hypothetical protein